MASALLIAMVMAVVVRGLLRSNPALQANHANTQRRALEAARSGLEYAKSRLGADPQWKANLSSSLVVDTPSLKVLEDRGNVIGLLSFDDGGRARFYLRFNFQDGSGGPDGLDDASAVLPMTGVSYNNIGSSATVMVPSADPDNYRVSSPPASVQELPGRAVVLHVVGEAGVGLSSMQDSNLYQEPTGFTHRETVASVLAAEVDLSGGDAVVMAGGGVDVTVASGSEISFDGAEDTPGRLRTKKGIALREGAGEADVRFTGDNAEIGFDENIGVTANFVGGTVPSETNEFVSDGVDFYNLPWEDVDTADSAPGTSQAVHLPGGVYVLWSPDEIRYYDMPVADYLSQAEGLTEPPMAPTTVITSSNFSEVRSPENVSNNPEGIEFTTQGVYLEQNNSGPGYAMQGPQVGDEGLLSISKDLYVKASATGTQDFALVSRDLTTEITGHASIGGSGGEDGGSPPPPPPSDMAVAVQIQQATVSCDANMYLRSGKIGLLEATLTGPGSLFLNTMELTGTAGHENLSVYFQDDVTISSYNGSRYGVINLAGTLYSHGNIAIEAGQEGLGANLWGKFTLEGNIVSYGGDPAQGTPGISGGAFSLIAKDADFVFDPTSVAGLFDLSEGLPEHVVLTSSSFNVASR